jgi:glycosyltransferase involved in cell wall biosynthesis
MRPRLTILIPTYNRGNLIEKTIQSCLSQTYQDFNIFIYDDASTDDTPKIAKGLIKKYPNKIKYYRNTSNRGIGYARNVLISNLETEFGVWLDSDDLMVPDRIEKCISYMDNNHNVDVVYSNIQWFTTNEDDINLKGHIEIDVTKYDKNTWHSLKFNTACATGFFRKKVTKFKFETELKLGGEDVLWIWKLLQNDIKIGHINESLYLYRNHTHRIGKQKRQESMKGLKEKEDAILALKIKEIQNDKS